MTRERATRPRAPPFIDPPGYTRHCPEATLLYQLVERYSPELVAAREAAGRPLPKYVQDEFAAYLKCGRLEHGFLRVRCEDCHAEKLVAFSCKRRGFCPSCGARRTTDSAALLADEVLPSKPLRQWVLSLPFALRFLLATDAEALTQVLGIAYRTISAHVLKKTGLARASGATGAVTLIKRFGSALNLNIHFRMLVLDGAYLVGTQPPVFRRMAPPGEAELQALVERLAERVGRALKRRGVLVRDAESTISSSTPRPVDRLTICSATRSRTGWPSARVPGRRCFRYGRCRRVRRGRGKAWRSTPGFRCTQGLAWRPNSGRSSKDSPAT
jgi:hypothetical protein